MQVTVILKHVFSPAELEEEPTMKTDLEADMASECAKLGPVDKVLHSSHCIVCFSVLSCAHPTAQELFHVQLSEDALAKRITIGLQTLSRTPLTSAVLMLLQIRVYQFHPEGVVSIKFKQGEPAQECLKLMNKRFFGGRQLTAELWDGITNYNVKKAQESEEEQAARLARFTAEIEQDQV